MSTSEEREARIRVLCELAAAAQNERALSIVLPQLQAALTEHTAHIRETAAEEIPRAFRSKSEAA
jgi:hypothetical protein